MTNSGISRVRGKFRVNAIERHRGSAPDESGEWKPCEMQTVKMGVVMGGSPEDNSYAQASPSGTIQLSITKPAVVGFFDLDQTYFVDFTVADEAVA